MLVGVAFGVVGHVAGEIGQALGLYNHEPEIGLGNNAVEFLNNPFMAPGSAVTLGNTICYAGGVNPTDYGAYGDPTVEIGRHEEAHTYQSQALGIFFLPVYFLNGGISGPSRNPFESAAQDYGRGGSDWWPF